jgi:hypothetical protein
MVEQQQLTGIWSRDNIDVNTIGQLEIIRANFSLSLNNKTRLSDLVEEFLSTTSAMQERIQKLFEHDDFKEIKEYEILMPDNKRYNWYKLRDNYDYFIDNVEDLRYLYEKLSDIYNHFLKRAKITIQMENKDPKKK